MCSPHDSSKWVKEYKSIFPTLENKRLKSSMEWEKESGKLAWSGGPYAWHKKNPEFWEDFYKQVPTLRQLYWAGGESLIMNEHYEVLKKIIELGFAKDIELRYNSNGIEWQSELFDLWKEYTDVYQSTYHFEHLNHAKSFFKYLDSEHPRCTKEFLDSWEVKPKELS